MTTVKIKRTDLTSDLHLTIGPERSTLNIV